MIGRIALSRVLLSRLPSASSKSVRSFGTLADNPSATDAWKKSCYLEIDFTISDKDLAIEAIHRMAAYDIGCLVTVDDQGKLSGVISERDMVTKVGLLGKRAQDIQIKEISTKVPNVVTATPEDSVDICMNKMLESDVRHLPILGENGAVQGLLSIKDCVKAVLNEKEDAIKTLSSFAAGHGGTFVVD
jgi:CBS-domain-containing membrane protein